MNDRTIALREIAAAYNLSATRIAEITGRTVDTVYHWLSGKHRTIPQDTLDLLKLRLQSPALEASH